MKKPRHFLAVFFACLLAVLFVATSVLALLEVDLRQNLLNPELLRSLLTDNEAYQQVPAVAAEVILETSAFEDLTNQGYFPPPFVLKIPENDLKKILIMVYPPEDIQAEVETYIEEVFTFLREESNEITFSMAALKAPLSGHPVEPYLQELLGWVPDCSPEEQAVIAAGPAPEDLPLCNPPEGLYVKYFKALKNQMFEADRVIEDEFHYQLAPGGPGDAPLATIRLMNRLLTWLPALPILFLLGVAALAVRSVKGALRWLGIPVFISGLLCLGVFISMHLFGQAAWESFLYSGNYEYLTFRVTNLLNPLGQSILEGLKRWLLLPALVLLGVGLAAWMASLFLKGKGQPPTSGGGVGEKAGDPAGMPGTG